MSRLARPEADRGPDRHPQEAGRDRAETRAATDQTPDQLVDAALALMLSGKSRAAIPILQSLFRDTPEHLRGRALFGLCALAEQDMRAAEENLRFVLGRSPDNPLARMGMARLAARNTSAPDAPGAPGGKPAAARDASRPDAGDRVSPDEIAAAVAALKGTRAAHPGGLVRGVRAVPGLVFAVVAGAVLAVLGGLIGANLVSMALGGSEIRPDQFLAGGPIFYGVAGLGAAIGLYLRRSRRARRAALAGPRAAGRRRAVKQVRPGLLRTALMAVIWIALLVAGGWLGFVIIGGEAAIFGAMGGVLLAQVVQVLLIKRR